MSPHASRPLFLSAFFFLAVVGWDASRTDAQDLKRMFGQRTKAAAQNSGELTPQAGPWLIMCTSFVGDSAEDEAFRLAQELNQKLRVPTYVYKHRFDFGNEYEGLYYSSNEENTEINEFGQRVPKRRKTKTLRESTIEEVAVLVGDFPAVDDARLQRLLEQIKYIPELEYASPDRNVHRPLMVHREIAKAFSENKSTKSKGPLGSAFALLNPLLPEDQLQQNTVDTTIINLNRGIDNSLLDCPGNYTIRVATFSGFATFQTEEIEKETKNFLGLKRLGKPITQSKLAEASEKAHVLCTELRKLGVEAYEFHDRLESYVCVGSYDWLSKEDPATGSLLINPEITKMILLFKGTVENLPNNPNQMIAKTLPSLEKRGIAFDMQPVPVAVPKVSTGTRTAGIPGLFR